MTGYGQAEITITMNECSAHQGMHINSDYGLCELVEDPSLPQGERRIVATCLHNEAMPLIPTIRVTSLCSTNPRTRRVHAGTRCRLFKEFVVVPMIFCMLPMAELYQVLTCIP